ncbi:lamin-B2 [Suricata suricatta]|uniref:lamin-B2 n=1 Tax=Suricata suricatta TaxID=37032 RepID=UPI001155E7DA|nr:lamin-B2 [Suricata suricatta]
MGTPLPGRAGGPATPLSPTRLSRLQEKEELRELNDRLAHYIDRVRALELENDRLLLKISEREEVTTREVSGIKTLYESELADARRVLDETARERARLQIELGKLEAELEEANKGSKKREGELTVAQGRVKDLESLFHRSEAELAAALSDKRGLESDVAELRAQLAKAEDGHAVAKKQLEKETLMRVDLENRCQSLQEELDFRKNVFEEEVRETRRRHERRLVEVDSSRQQEYDFKMAQALEELRSQHDEQVRLYKLELEQTYQAKVPGAAAGLKLTPSPSSRITVSRATSSSSGSSVAVAGRPGRSKRRRLEVEESPASSGVGSGGGGSSGGFHLAQQASATGGIAIEEVDLEGRFVQLKNSSDKDQSLGNWRIKRQVLEGEEIAYKFTPKYVLRAGQTVTVWAAGAGVAHSPPSTLVWKSQSSWSTGESFRTVLVNADGEEVAMRTVKQSAAAREAENGEEGEEEGAEFGEEDLFHQQGDPRTTSRGCRVM